MAAWDAYGWFHTGDVAMLHERTLAVAIIDRKKNIFKLSQGEYIAPDKIEAVYAQAAFVSQIFVFGYSHEVANTFHTEMLTHAHSSFYDT